MRADAHDPIVNHARLRRVVQQPHGRAGGVGDAVVEVVPGQVEGEGKEREEDVAAEGVDRLTETHEWWKDVVRGGKC